MAKYDLTVTQGLEWEGVEDLDKEALDELVGVLTHYWPNCKIEIGAKP
jgi:hypothetical protein